MLRKPKRLWPTAVLRNDIYGFLVFSDVMSSLGKTSNRGDYSVALLFRNDVWAFRDLLIVYLGKLIIVHGSLPIVSKTEKMGFQKWIRKATGHQKTSLQRFAEEGMLLL